MTRPIKFRAWDKKGGAMLVEVGVTREGYCAVSPDKDRFVPMQFTGLHDKNGKESFEGDIVHTDFNKMGLSVSKNTIEFQFGGFCCIDKNGKFNGYLGKKDFEVIGNIYSNPELIK